MELKYGKYGTLTVALAYGQKIASKNIPERGDWTVANIVTGISSNTSPMYGATYDRPTDIAPKITAEKNKVILSSFQYKWQVFIVFFLFFLSSPVLSFIDIVSWKASPFDKLKK